MKKLVIALSLVALATTTVASATLINASTKQKKLEQVTRAQTLAVVAANGGNFELACKAQAQAVEILSTVKTKGHDLRGFADASRDQLCRKTS